MGNIFAEFLQTAGLYDSISVNESNISELCDLLLGKVRISEYCTKCGEKRVFTIEPVEYTEEIVNGTVLIHQLGKRIMSQQNVQKMGTMGLPGERREERKEWKWIFDDYRKESRIIVLSFTCTMQEDHHLDYVVLANDYEIIKIGQHPSVADVSLPQIAEYKKVIDEASVKELKRAIGLHAQGIGVGSYVYLRRIFERILDKAKKQAEDEKKIELSGYKEKSVSDRIKMLAGYLPDMIVQNTVLYGVVSAGIHGLSEDDCLRYFPVLRDCIIMILKQWQEKQERKEQEEKLRKSMQEIASEVSSLSK